MSLRKMKPSVRDKPTEARSAVWLSSTEAYETLCCSGYTRLGNNPEVSSAVDTIAKLVASMTIHLMENTDDGDVRVRNSLSRKIDIEPNAYMTRANYIYWIVKTMMLGGEGNAVVLPTTKSGYLDQLHPVPPNIVSFRPEGWGYRISIGGKEYDPGDLLHFVLNPDENQPWRCVLAHTHYGEPGWNPAAMRSLWAPYHATKREYALAWVAPTNATDAYNEGEWMVWTDGLAYRALRNAVDRGPDVLPDAWEVEN